MPLGTHFDPLFTCAVFAGPVHVFAVTNLSSSVFICHNAWKIVPLFLTRVSVPDLSTVMSSLALIVLAPQ